MKFTVTTNHVLRGEPGHGDNCPVTRCLRESLPGVHVFVHETTILLDGEEFEMDDRLKGKIARYDIAVSMGPFEFELPVPMRILGKVRNPSTAGIRRPLRINLFGD